MDTKTQIATLTSLIGQKQNEMDVLNVALSLVQDGYQSDTEKITAATQAAQDVAVKTISDFKASITAAVQ